jgi:predicted dehydrogenase
MADMKSIGILGAGHIASSVHIPTLMARPDVHVEWIMDTDRKKCDQVARAFGIGQVLNNLAELPDADIVVMSIPYGARAGYFPRLSRSGSAVYVEKPFAKSVLEHSAVCAQFPDYKIACGFQRRVWGPTVLTRSLVNAGYFGALRRVRLGFGSPGLIVSGRYSSNLELAGGGILMEMGVHLLDALLHILNAEDISATDVNMVSDCGFDVHVTAGLLVSTKQFGNVACDCCISYMEQTINGLQFEFERGTLCFQLFGSGDIYLQEQNGCSRTYLSSKYPVLPASSIETFHAFWCMFIDGLNSRIPNCTAASQSILTTKAVDLLYSTAGRHS